MNSAYRKKNPKKPQTNAAKEIFFSATYTYIYIVNN